MIHLTPEQSELLRAAGTPPEVLDPETDVIYVLVRSEIFERARGLLELEEEGMSEAAYHHAMEVFGRDGWNDPAMDIYNDLDPRGQQ